MNKFFDIDKPVSINEPLHLALGMFDGVHEGHSKVIQTAIGEAKKLKGKSAVLTFWPHPSKILSPSASVPLMLDLNAKTQRLDSQGLDYTFLKTFTSEFSTMSAEEFLPYLKTKLPTLSALYVGENFAFGKGRSGNLESLTASGKKIGIKVIGLKRKEYLGKAISSTRIREAIVKGKIKEANSMLGFKYFAKGTVVKGKQLGRTIGFPTLNIKWTSEISILRGVYMVLVSDEESTASIQGIANFGSRPTLNENTPEELLEVHTLETPPWTTGHILKVEFCEFIREEQIFASIDLLKEQIETDKAKAIRLFTQL